MVYAHLLPIIMGDVIWKFAKILQGQNSFYICGGINLYGGVKNVRGRGNTCQYPQIILNILKLPANILKFTEKNPLEKHQFLWLLWQVLWKKVFSLLGI